MQDSIMFVHVLSLTHKSLIEVYHGYQSWWSDIELGGIVA